MTSDILIIDDESGIRSLIKGILEDEGYQAREAHNDVSAYDSVQNEKPDLVILDIWLQNSQDDGIEILKNLKKDYPHMPIIMISGHGNIETAVKTIKLGAYDFIEKPFKTDRLLLMIERAIEAASLRKENETLRQKTGLSTEFIGQSETVKNLQTVLDKIAQTNSRVLISGASGCGKNVAARYIHSRSDRASKTFGVLYCAQTDKKELQQMILGSESSNSTTPGLFEQNNGGTILFDEVSRLPVDVQGTLVKILQTGELTRLGGSEPIKIDIRTIATTSRDLLPLIDNKEFREDLYYRLNVVPVSVPSLKERVQDIPAFIEYFVSSFTRENGLQETKFAECAVAALQTYSWPGNIRQLKNVIEWLIITHGVKTKLIKAEMLPTSLSPSQTSDIDNDIDNGASKINMTDFASLPLREAREEFECEYLSSQIERFGGNISKTAEFIGMERSALHRKLKQLGLTGTTTQKSDQVNAA